MHTSENPQEEGKKINRTKRFMKNKATKVAGLLALGGGIAFGGIKAHDAITADEARTSEIIADPVQKSPLYNRYILPTLSLHNTLVETEKYNTAEFQTLSQEIQSLTNNPGSTSELRTKWENLYSQLQETEKNPETKKTGNTSNTGESGFDSFAQFTGLDEVVDMFDNESKGEVWDLAGKLGLKSLTGVFDLVENPDNNELPLLMLITAIIAGLSKLKRKEITGMKKDITTEEAITKTQQLDKYFAHLERIQDKNWGKSQQRAKSKIDDSYDELIKRNPKLTDTIEKQQEFYNVLFATRKHEHDDAKKSHTTLTSGNNIISGNMLSMMRRELVAYQKEIEASTTSENEKTWNESHLDKKLAFLTEGTEYISADFRNLMKRTLIPGGLLILGLRNAQQYLRRLLRGQDIDLSGLNLKEKTKKIGGIISNRKDINTPSADSADSTPRILSQYNVEDFSWSFAPDVSVNLEEEDVAHMANIDGLYQIIEIIEQYGSKNILIERTQKEVETINAHIADIEKRNKDIRENTSFTGAMNKTDADAGGSMPFIGGSMFGMNIPVGKATLYEESTGYKKAIDERYALVTERQDMLKQLDTFMKDIPDEAINSDGSIKPGYIDFLKTNMNSEIVLISSRILGRDLSSLEISTAMEDRGIKKILEQLIKRLDRPKR